MRIIIPGGTGLVGRALASHLAAADYEVIVLSRAPQQATGFPAGVRTESWDARTSAGWAPLADGAGAIINLAGASLSGQSLLPKRWTPERKRSIRDSRVHAGQAIVEAVERARNKPGVVIQSSGVGIYGPRSDELVGEDAAVGDGFLSRLAYEEWEPSTAPVEALGVRRAIIRTAAVLTTDGGALPSLLLPFRLFVGGPMGSGRQGLSWIHIQDEVRAIQFLIENEAARGPFNLSAPNPLTNAQFARLLGRVMGRPSFIPVPAFAMRLAFGEVANVLLEGQQAVPQRLLDLGFQFCFPDAESALRDLLT